MPPERNVDKFGWFGNRFLFLYPAFYFAKLPKSAGEILVGKFGRIDFSINLFLFGFVGFQKEEISLLKSGKILADFFDFGFLFFGQSIEVLFQIFEKLFGFVRKSYPQRKRVFLMGKYFKFGCKFDLKSFVVMQAWKKTK